MVRNPFSRGAALVVLAAACTAWASRAHDCGTRSAARPAVLVLVNHTDCPIEIYLNDRFLLRCDPFLKQTIRTRRTGEVRLLGRFRCDTWGPTTAKLTPGRRTVWRLGASNRRTRGGRTTARRR